jgi:hypothetical protein
MAFFEDILNGLTQPAARPSFGSMAVKAPTSTTGVAPSMAQPKLAQDSSGWDDMATFFAGMGEGGGALLPALGAGARAVSGEKDRRQRVNDTYDFLLRNGVAPEDAKATMASPDLLKMKLGQIFAPKTMTVNPGQKIIDAQGNVIMDNSETMKPTPEQSNFMYGQQNPEFLGFLDQQRARTAKPTLDQQVVEREAVADKLGLDGDIRKHFVATGTMPRTAPPQEMREYQTKDAMWADRLLRAEKRIDDVAGIDAKTGKPAQGAYNPARAANAWWPDNAYGANLANSKEWQQYQQAAREGIAAILRKDTGAAVTQTEWDLYFPMLYPQPGDSPEVVAQKKASREANAHALRASSGRAFEKMFPEYGSAKPADGTLDLGDGFTAKVK